jgi:hypothetical protein
MKEPMQMYRTKLANSARPRVDEIAMIDQRAVVDGVRGVRI